MTMSKTKKATKKSSKSSARPLTIARIGDEAVAKATGCSWSEWLPYLDRKGCRHMSHGEIAGVVARCAHPSGKRIGGWWSQMVTVGYEQARGLRDKYETARGYQVGGSRTVGVPVAELFAAFADPKLRKRWLPEPITVRKHTKNKSLRCTWKDGRTDVDVNLFAKGKAKSMAHVQHSKLPDKKSATRMKTFWAKRLDGLAERLEA